MLTVCLLLPLIVPAARVHLNAAVVFVDGRVPNPPMAAVSSRHRDDGAAVLETAFSVGRQSVLQRTVLLKMKRRLNVFSLTALRQA